MIHDQHQTFRIPMSRCPWFCPSLWPISSPHWRDHWTAYQRQPKLFLFKQQLKVCILHVEYEYFSYVFFSYFAYKTDNSHILQVQKYTNKYTKMDRVRNYFHVITHKIYWKMFQNKDSRSSWGLYLCPVLLFCAKHFFQELIKFKLGFVHIKIKFDSSRTDCQNHISPKPVDSFGGEIST
jgi:hypothetical protein